MLFESLPFNNIITAGHLYLITIPSNTATFALTSPPMERNQNLSEEYDLCASVPGNDDALARVLTGLHLCEPPPRHYSQLHNDRRVKKVDNGVRISTVTSTWDITAVSLWHWQCRCCFIFFHWFFSLIIRNHFGHVVWVQESRCGAYNIVSAFVKLLLWLPPCLKFIWRRLKFALRCPFFYFGPAYRYATGCNGALTDMHPIILIRNRTWVAL